MRAPTHPSSEELKKEIYDFFHNLNSDQDQPSNELVKNKINEIKNHDNSRDILNTLQQNKDNKSETIIHLLVRKNFSRILRVILNIKDKNDKYVVDLHVKDSDNRSPLFLALTHLAYKDALRVLLSSSLTNNITQFSIPHTQDPTKKESFLHFFCRYKSNNEGVDEKYKIGIWNGFLKINNKIREFLATTNKNGETPLMVACSFGQFKLALEILTLPNAVDIESKNKLGETISNIIENYARGMREQKRFNVYNENDFKELKQRIEQLRKNTPQKKSGSVHINPKFVGTLLPQLSLPAAVPYYYPYPFLQPNYGPPSLYIPHNSSFQQGTTLFPKPKKRAHEEEYGEKNRKKRRYEKN